MVPVVSIFYAIDVRFHIFFNVAKSQNFERKKKLMGWYRQATRDMLFRFTHLAGVLTLPPHTPDWRNGSALHTCRCARICFRLN